MNYNERCDVIERLERQHEHLIDQLDELNLQIENVLNVRPSSKEESTLDNA